MKTSPPLIPIPFWDYYHRPLGMTLAGGVFSCLMVLPLGYIIAYGLRAGGDSWVHLWSDWIPGLLGNTLALGLGTAFITFILGTTLAWLVTRFEFPGRRVWSWVLAAPLGIPPYIMAYVYTELFLPGGWAQTLAQAIFGAETRLPMLYGSYPAVVIVLSLATYPYVYLLVRTSLLSHNLSFEEVAQTQGISWYGRLMRITLPLHRPSVMAGLFLVVMYAFADFGAVSMMRYSTFTRAIYLELVGRNDRVSASMLSLVLIGLSVLLLWLERRSRSRSKFYQNATSFRPVIPQRLGKTGVVLVWAYFLSVSALAFGLVIAHLVSRSVSTFAETGFPHELWSYAANSLIVSGGAATTSVFMIIPLAYLATRYPDKIYQIYLRLSYAGYVLPGPIIGVGVLFMAIGLTPVIYGTAFTVILAYLIRFLPQGLQAQEAAFQQVKPNIEEAARSLGSGFHASLLRVLLPLIKPGILTGWVLVFVSSMKELPATLLLRPLGFDTLAIRIWIETSEEFYELAAPAALLLIVFTFPLFAMIQSRTAKQALL